MDTAPLLTFLSENTQGEGYTVFDWSDLIAVSEHAREELGALKTNGYAVIKYSDESEVCLCVTASGRAAAAAARIKTAVIAAIFGIFGGAVGGAVIYLILSKV